MPNLIAGTLRPLDPAKVLVQIGILLAGNEAFAASGPSFSCRVASTKAERCGAGTTIVCSVECDGGGIAVDLDLAGDGVIVRFDRGPGRISMEGWGEGKSLDAGLDGRAFLVRAPAAVCSSLARRTGSAE